MLLSCHRLVAEKAVDFVNQEQHIVLDKKKMKFGCMLPDLHPAMMFKSHEMKGSLDFLFKKMDQIMGLAVFNHSVNLQWYSLNLGIILHYLTDYFCKVHNTEESMSYLDHNAYERKLKKYFQSNFYEIEQQVWQDRIQAWSGIKDIKQFIETKHGEYMKLRDSMAKDLMYSTEVCIVVALYLTHCCLISVPVVSQAAGLEAV